MIRCTSKYQHNSQPGVLRIRVFRGSLIVCVASFLLVVGVPTFGNNYRVPYGPHIPYATPTGPTAPGGKIIVKG
jgi:hypothetical protein